MDGNRHSLPFDHRAPGIARRLVQHEGADWSADLLESALLATSELVTNAVLYGAAQVTLEISTTVTPLRVEVHDSGHETLLQSADSGGQDGADSQGDCGRQVEGGRGLAIVRVLASRWGVTTAQQPPGKTVWFEMSPSS